MNPFHDARGELVAAIIAVAVWSLLGITILFPPSGGGALIRNCQTTVNATTPAASCRIHNQLPGGATNIGSGTLIDVMPGGERGLVLTCAHLFSEGKGQVVVEFPGGKTHGALVVAIDGAADLAALEIARPVAAPASVDRELRAMGNLTACGFGPSGAYRCVAGPAIGFSNGPGQTSVRIAGAVRSGDSGGGVFDDRGQLVAVVWGESGGVTYASTGGPLSRFLDRALQRRGTSGAGQGLASPSVGALACPDGRCPLVGGGLPLSTAPTLPLTPVTPISPITPTAPSQACDCSAAMAALAERLEALDARRTPSEPAVGNELPSTFSAATRAAALMATALLGVSGPAGWGIIAASSAGGWLIGRGIKRRKLRAASSELREEEPPLRQSESSHSKLATHGPQLDSSEATAAAAGAFPGEGKQAVAITEHSPIERDDREARELLRLSQLEGRDPLQDAVAGRLALDRLDATAESDPDPHRVRWADELRRELRERFNDIAPTKFKGRAILNDSDAPASSSTSKATATSGGIRNETCVSGRCRSKTLRSTSRMTAAYSTSELRATDCRKVFAGCTSTAACSPRRSITQAATSGTDASGW